jgi:hypothetical protein
MLLESRRNFGSPLERRTTDMQTTRSFIGMDVHRQAIALKVKQKFAARDKAKKEVKPSTPKPQAKKAA